MPHSRRKRAKAAKLLEMSTDIEDKATHSTAGDDPSDPLAQSYVAVSKDNAEINLKSHVMKHPAGIVGNNTKGNAKNEVTTESAEIVPSDDNEDNEDEVADDESAATESDDHNQNIAEEEGAEEAAKTDSKKDKKGKAEQKAADQHVETVPGDDNQDSEEQEGIDDSAENTDSSSSNPKQNTTKAKPKKSWSVTTTRDTINTTSSHINPGSKEGRKKKKTKPNKSFCGGLRSLLKGILVDLPKRALHAVAVFLYLSSPKPPQTIAQIKAAHPDWSGQRVKNAARRASKKKRLTEGTKEKSEDGSD